MCTNAVPQAQGRGNFDPLHAITNAQQSLIKLTFEILDGVMDGTVADVTAPLIAQLRLPVTNCKVMFSVIKYLATEYQVKISAFKQY